MVVDARDPLFYRCPDLEVCIQSLPFYGRAPLHVTYDMPMPPCEAHC